MLNGRKGVLSGLIILLGFIGTLAIFLLYLFIFFEGINIVFKDKYLVDFLTGSIFILTISKQPYVVNGENYKNSQSGIKLPL